MYSSYICSTCMKMISLLCAFVYVLSSQVYHFVCMFRLFFSCHVHSFIHRSCMLMNLILGFLCNEINEWEKEREMSATQQRTLFLLLFFYGDVFLLFFCWAWERYVACCSKRSVQFSALLLKIISREMFSIKSYSHVGA